MFAVAVVSAPNQELPEETGRFLGSLTLGESRQRATGTPEPDPPGRNLPGWGMAIDPDGDCKFTPANRGMTIEVPTTIHDLGGPNRIFNAPRVMQEVDGDFTITVKVTGQFLPGPQSSNPGSFPYNGAGIVVWSDSDNFIRLERAAVLRGNSVLTNLAFLEHEGGYGGANHSDALGNSDCFLRVRRKGSRIYAGVSGDGNNWRWLRPIDTIWPSKLKVGLTAITTSSTPFLAKFEEFDFRADAMPPAAGGAGFTPPTAPQPPANRPNTGVESTPFAPTVVNSPNPGSSSSSSTKSRRTMIVVIAVVCGLLVLVALAGLGGVGLWMLIASKPTPAERPARPRARGRRID
jgi:regulation of enolase protein 1 (concanavalin A-like superfamily)